MTVFKIFKEYQRLRNINGEIHIDKRPTMFRWKESRWTTLDDLTKLLSDLSSHRYLRLDVLKCILTMMESTYKNDTKWVSKAREVLAAHKE